MKTNLTTGRTLSRLAMTLAAVAVLGTSQTIWAAPTQTDNDPAANSTERSASAKSGSGNSSVPNGGSTQSGHNERKIGAHLRGNSTDSQYQHPDRPASSANGGDTSSGSGTQK